MEPRWIYKTDRNNSSRYILGIEGENPLICIGINPSTASPDKLDNTLKSVQRQAFEKGFDSWIMLNVYPQRATNPKDIHIVPDLKLHRQNLKSIAELLKNYSQINVWAAWGNLIESRDFFGSFLTDIVNLLNSDNTSWVSVGKCSKAGHPHHPLYLSATAAIETFDMDTYLSKLKK